MAKNIEIKLKVKDLASIIKRAKAIATDKTPRVLNQVDIYYKIPNGRLKLRIINGKKAVLIAYQRSNEKKARASNYHLTYINNIQLCDATLARQLGRRAVVIKKRIVYMYDNTRIHLDEVRGLGSFVEFEYVVGPGCPEEKGAAVIERLKQKISVGDAVVCKESYVDLIRLPSA